MPLLSMLMKVGIVLLVFTLIVMAHEFGHFIIAKRNGVLVQEFAIGMGPKLFSKQWGETLYSIRILPIGGFCMMQEEFGDFNDTRSLSSKTVLQRIAILIAGPLMNFLFAFVLMFIIVSAQGEGSNIIGKLEPGFPAENAGMQIGDKIVMVNGVKTKNMKDITKQLSSLEDQNITFTISRDGKQVDLNITRLYSEKEQRYLVGFTSKMVKGNIVGNIQKGFTETINLVKMTIEGFAMLLTRQVSMGELTGPVGVINAGVKVWDEGLTLSVWVAIQQMLFLGALISANLGVFNLLPFPALDGGRILFLIIEGVRGKPIDSNKEAFVHFIGFALLMILMVIVLYNDITRSLGLRF